MYGKGHCRVTVKTATGKRSFWAEKLSSTGKVTVYEELTREGDPKGSANPNVDRHVYCVAAAADIIRERPVDYNLKYGMFEVIR